MPHLVDIVAKIVHQPLYKIWHGSRKASFHGSSCLLLGLSIVVPVFSQPGQMTETVVESGVLLVQYEHGSFHGKIASSQLLNVQSVDKAFPFLGTLIGKRAQLSSIEALQRVYRVHYNADIPPHQAARMIALAPGIVYAEPEVLYSVNQIPASRNTSEEKNRLESPNDPLFVDDGYMQMMEITKAWEVVKGEQSDVVIAIVDDGVDYEHPDLHANVWYNPDENPDNGIDDDRNGYIDDLHGWNFEKNTNNPKPSAGNTHGTEVSGVAMAVADNDMGMAGISWNAKFMPINVACGPRSSLLCNAYDGLLYAAMNGAQIINASYGGLSYGSGSETEALVLRAVSDLGSLVVSGAGNNRRRLGGYNPYFYPGSNPLTLSVCGTQSESYQNVFNYGYTVDVCTAGSQILTTGVNHGYHRRRGTSFATPIVSGIAALVKTRFPHYSPAQIREQIRATADLQLYDHNTTSLDGLLGRGYVNAFRAVTETDLVSVRMIDWNVKNDDHCFAPSELINISATFESYLEDGQNLTLELIPNSPHVVFPSGNLFSIDALRKGKSVTIDFSILPSADIAHRSFLFIEPRIRAADGEIVSGSDAIEVFIHAAQLAAHETDTFTYTMTSEGNIGTTDISEGMIRRIHCKKPMGQMKLKGQDWMSQAGLLIGTSPSRMTGSVFIKSILGLECILCPGIQNHDYLPSDQIVVENRLDGQQISRVTLTDKTNNLPEGLRIVQESMVSNQNQFEDIALFRYQLLNPTALNMSGLYAGLYFDPIEDDGYGLAKYQHQSIEKVFPYVRSLNTSESAYVGFIVITESSLKHYKTYDTRETWRLSRPNNAWNGLTGGIIEPAGGNGSLDKDNSQLIGSGPHDILAYSDIIIEFAMIYGDSYADLLRNAQRMHLLSDQWSESTSISAPSKITVNEGDSTTFLVHLSGTYPKDVRFAMTGFEGTDIKPNPESLTFSENQSISFQPVTIHATVDDDIDHDEVILKFVDSGNELTTNELTIHVTIMDHGVGAVSAPSMLEIAEGETQSIEVGLKARPQRKENVTVNITGYDNTDLMPKPTILTFTDHNWNTPQTVSVVASEDNDLSDDQLSLNLNILGGGYATSYAFPVKIIDRSIGGISAVDSILIDEGETELFEIVLNSKPIDYVIVSITGHEGTGLRVIPIHMVFRQDNWFISQNVTLDAKEDQDASNDEFALTFLASGGGYDSVQHTLTVTINDNDTAMISAPTSITIMEGDSASFLITPLTPPSSDVRMVLSGHENTDLTLIPTDINFGVHNWSSAHMISMITSEDKDYIDDQIKLFLSASGGGYDRINKEILVTITDNLGVGVERLDLPNDLALSGNYPNPSTETTIIEFDLPEPAEVSVSIIDLLSRTVKKLPLGRFDAGWEKKIEINLRDLAPGLYYCVLQIEMGDETAYMTQPITVL